MPATKKQSKDIIAQQRAERRALKKAQKDAVRLEKEKKGHFRLVDVQQRRLDELTKQVSSDVYGNCLLVATNLVDNTYHIPEQLSDLAKRKASMQLNNSGSYCGRKHILSNRRKKLIREQLLCELDRHLKSNM